MPDKDEVQQAVDALWKVYRIRNECNGNTQIIQHIKQVAKELAASDTKGGRFGGIRKTVADAITKAYINAPLDHL